MIEEAKGQLIDHLQATHKQLSALLESVADNQDWQPGPEGWSFRYIAAHMATVEDECFLERVKRFSTEESPNFDHYDNTGWDFSHFELTDSLRNWAALRRGLLDMVRTVPESVWLRSATHSTRGTQTLLELLHVMLEHDQEHLQEVKRMTNRL